MSAFLLSCCLGVASIAQTPHLPQQSDADGIYYSGYATAHKENSSNDWKIGGKIHFEEGSSSDYIGTIAINELTRKVMKNIFDIQFDSCASNAKVLLKKESNQIILTHREERSKPGIGEELHATLLYTSKRVERGHETLHDIYNNLRQVDASLPQDRAPTIQQVADAYQKFIKPDWRFQISDVQLISNATGSFIIARLELNGQDEIQNNQGSPISGDFLHLTLAMIESSISEIEKIQSVVSELKTALAGKTVKIGNRNGYADLEFGVSGSSARIRPTFERKDVVIRSNQEKFSAPTLLTKPHLSITEPAGQTIDREIHIQVENLTPFQEVALQAEAKDQKGDIWSSHATFRADARGQVDVASVPPIGNSSYEGIDAMGIFWSMLPASGDTAASFKCKHDTIPVEIKLYVAGDLAVQETVTRYLKAPDVKRIDVKENGLVGALFLPKSERPLPVIITLSGSNGGLSENRAKLLASNGFAVFALGYFGVDGLPSNLQDIPLEYFEAAFAWMKEQPNLDSSHVGLYGASRGAELSLILGSFFPNSIQAIVAVVPSSVIYGGLSETPVNAWTYQGKPILPFAPVPQTDFADGKGKTPENPANTRQSFLEGMKNEAAFAAASIPVENIRCPIFLVSGGDDQMWPSDLYVQQIMDRLTKTHSSIVCRHLHYPDAGHGINIPNLPIPGPTYYHPVGKLWFSMGGTRTADARASSDAWNKLVAFFHESLGDEANNKQNSNQEKFSALRSFQLPIDQYAITGSGPLGIRNLKAIGDIDIIVTPQLWTTLAEKYGVTDENGVRKIVLPGEVVEAFAEGSFYTAPTDPQAPTIAARIKDAEIIDGLPFDSIENVLYYKHKDTREKDLKDILLIEQWMRMQKS